MLDSYGSISVSANCYRASLGFHTVFLFYKFNGEADRQHYAQRESYPKFRFGKQRDIGIHKKSSFLVFFPLKEHIRVLVIPLERHKLLDSAAS